ncbi:hypothetical protein ACEPAI_1614 [Sanghuangporus weigelae]
MSEPSVGLFVPLPANDGQASAVTDFLRAGHSLLKDEPLTLQWYALQYESSTPTFAIFDTFAEEEGRATHLTGKIAEALVANAPSLIAGAPQINKAKILASKIQKAEVKLGLRVLAEAKEDKVEDVKNFLISALPLVEEETLTPQWYAIQLEGSNVFGILDFSEAEEGRQAHLNGKVAAALFAKVDELFVKKPEVVKVDVVASRVL